MKLALESLDFKTDPLENYYELHEELGRGNFAVVKKCRNKESNEEFAAKCITKKRSKASKKGMSKDAIQTEASILLSVDHDGVIKLYDIFETRQNITLVMELLTGGELFEEISKEEFILEKDACHYMKQILDAVGHLHENNIVHLDLKPENIVLKNKGEKDIKLVDFGLARKLEPGVEHREMMGTPEFAAPETISFDPIGYYTDMWALGVVTYILLSGASPFLGDDDQETYQNITSCEYDFDDEYFSKITENAKDFIRRLLLKNGSKRNTVKDCLKHPWIACEEEENSVIDTKKMRAFVARRRWKQSLRMVTMISRLRVLARNSSPTSDTSGDEDSQIESPTTPMSPIGFDEVQRFSPTNDNFPSGRSRDSDFPATEKSNQASLRSEEVEGLKNSAERRSEHLQQEEPVSCRGSSIPLAGKADKLRSNNEKDDICSGEQPENSASGSSQNWQVSEEDLSSYCGHEFVKQHRTKKGNDEEISDFSCNSLQLALNQNVSFDSEAVIPREQNFHKLLKNNNGENKESCSQYPGSSRGFLERRKQLSMKNVDWGNVIPEFSDSDDCLLKQAILCKMRKETSV